MWVERWWGPALGLWEEFDFIPWKGIRVWRRSVQTCACVRVRRDQSRGLGKHPSGFAVQNGLDRGQREASAAQGGAVGLDRVEAVGGDPGLGGSGSDRTRWDRAVREDAASRGPLS